MANLPQVVPNGVDGILPEVQDSQQPEVSSTIKVLPSNFYDSFLSTEAKERKPSPIRGLFPLEKTPGVISLLAGKPNTATFPFASLQFTTGHPSDPAQQVTLKVDDAVLAEGLQYAATDGITPFVAWLYGLQERQHGRKKGEGWRISVTSGSQDAIYKAVHALVNHEDPVLVEKPVYAGVIPIFESLHCEMVEVETDAQGIDAQSLRSILESWPSSKLKPKVLYTVPYGCNPTGMTAALDRRLEVIELSRQHDFIILEDDPYYYLYFGSAPRIPSYFTLEAQTGVAGRVLRFDSFSKILSAGIRIGFVTGPDKILAAIDSHTASANLQASSFTQSVVVTLLDAWGYDGFLAHTHTVSQFYRSKRDVFEAALRRHLDGLAEWVSPEAGMFFWFKLLLNDDTSVEGDSAHLIQTKAYENGVLALPGTVFLPNGASTAYVRASFSLLEEDEVNEALRRLRVVILKERGQA
ncbi:PLP-dependent transferase [Artomyces pyxidatus]|uniref:PLP-dependent transferase n=1 Tax=Artomyces pyxidatus TaxID=48021 RepID=A0ACB8SQD2_9AGAM|nr:PLP-dependent transferase [Artomyces pyxidatus]